jgi:hypothetical protein
MEMGKTKKKTTTYLNLREGRTLNEERHVDCDKVL